MKLNYISTLALNNSLRSGTLEKQVALNKAQLEVSTGKHADIGRELGGFTSTTISLEKQVLLIDQIKITNSVVGNGMTAMQQAIGSTIDQANSFLGQLTVELSDSLDPDLLDTLGNSMLGVVHSNMNVTFKGDFLFSGLNTDTKALVDYDGTDGLPAKTAVQDAFATTFGFNADDPLAQYLTATDIEGFINGPFQDLFDDLNWETLWSGSSERGRGHKISANEFVENSTTANNQAFRSITAASVLIAEFGNANFGADALDQLVNSSIQTMHVGIDQLGEEQATMGVIEERINNATEQLDFQQNVLANQLSQLTEVDPYEAALNLNQLTTSLEASYAATARIQALSLLNFI